MKNFLIFALLLLLWVEKSFAGGKSSERVPEPFPPKKAAETMVVPEGFHVSLFAGEPDLKQPIGFCIDDRGRVWVAEANNFPDRDGGPNDRILIYEDSDGDGQFDKRTVFYDKLNYVSGIEVGFGGVWVLSQPYFYFIPDRDGDDVPDGEPEVLLDGFGNHANPYNMANGLAWGPDGWLYGTHGRTNWSLLGKPGTPPEERVRFDGGVYRYHPTRHVWESYADGTTNPWGIDWNDYGDAFVTNCVNPHLFHVIPGAHYEPWRNRESSRHAYERIPTIADHLHFVGKTSVQEGLGSVEEDEAGGGHAHCGTMIYLGDNWPEKYRNDLFTNNVHGRRINNDSLRRQGSGYVASHRPDLMRTQDPWFIGVTIAYTSDGGVYVSDWSDTGECHTTQNTDRQTGRIYKITYGETSNETVDLTNLTNQALVQLQTHRNDWYVRHARRLLQEHTAAGQDMSAARKQLQKMYDSETDIPRKLRALWALHVTGGLDEEFLLGQLADPDEYVRAWSVRLLCEASDPSQAVISSFCDLAKTDSSEYVLLYLASMLQRLDLNSRWDLASTLSQCELAKTPHTNTLPSGGSASQGRGGEATITSVAARRTHHPDEPGIADDPNLPLMLWYGLEPLVNVDVNRFIDLAGTSAVPLISRHIARRTMAEVEKKGGLPELLALIQTTKDAWRRDELLTGMLAGLQGRRSVPMPASWPAVFQVLRNSPQDAIREKALELALLFNDDAALDLVKQQAADVEAPATTRTWAVNGLIAKKPQGLAEFLLSHLNDPEIQDAVLLGLAEYDDEAIAPEILGHYDRFSDTGKSNAVQTLASRPAWANQLLDAVEAGQIPITDLTAYTARQIQNLNNPELADRVKSLWGEVNTTSAERKAKIESYVEQLTPEVIALGDKASGRAVFEKTCAVCHTLMGKGGKVGPDLTGMQRTNIPYLLENIIDPSALVSRDYKMEIVVTDTGRVITGLVVNESDKSITIQTANEQVVVPADEIEVRNTSPLSMMPEGMLNSLTADQVRDLFTFLASPDFLLQQ